MLELRDAFEVLGIKEGATKDEIVKRYDLLLKKHRMSLSGNNEEDSEKINIDEVNRAYNVLMGYGDKTQQQEEPPLNTVLTPLYKKAGIDEKKARNFFYYYKFHILAIIAGVLILWSIVSSMVNRVNPDINIVIAGEFHAEQTESFTNEIKNSIPEIKEVGIDPIFLSKDPKSQMDTSMRMKFVTIIAAGDTDVLILDRANFEDLAKKGAFVKLDELAGPLGIDMEANKNNIIQEEESGKKYLYGVDVSKSPALKSINFLGQEKIAVIRTTSKHYDLSLSLIKLLVNG